MDNNNKGNKNGFPNKAAIIIILISSLFIGYMFMLLSDQIREGTRQEISYDKFLDMLEQGTVEEVVYKSDQFLITPKGQDEMPFKVTYYTGYLPDPGIVDRLEAAGVVYKSKLETQNLFMSILSMVLPFIAIYVVMWFLFKAISKNSGGVMGVGKSNAKVYVEKTTGVTFRDVAGQEEAKESVTEIVDFLHNPAKYTRIGAKLPKGALLVGPPGTGKTLLAKAVAGEAKVPFFSLSGSDFVEMFVGVGASRVRDLFEQAKKNAPCIVFIDEIDAVGRQRGAGLGGGHDEREQTLNQLLVEMDGFEANEGIIIIAATNRPDILDPALLRPGRFDRQVTMDVPDILGREEILKVHTRGKQIAPDVDLNVLARRTPGFTGADLANLVNEAALLSARRGQKRVTMDALEESVERVIAGPEKKSRVISDYEKRLVSYHEAGHALVGHLLPHTDPLHKVSIIPRGRAGGYTLLLPREDRRYMTKSQILDQVTMLLGGRVAEDLVLQEISTGAQNDLERATTLVRKIITEFGMSDELGPLTFGTKQEQIFLGRDIARDRNYSEAVAFSIDKEARKIMDECYSRAETLLKENIEKLHLVASHLMEKETLEAEEFEALMENGAITDEENQAKGGPEEGSPLDAASSASTGDQETEPDVNLGGINPGKPTISFNFHIITLV